MTSWEVRLTMPSDVGSKSHFIFVKHTRENKTHLNLLSSLSTTTNNSISLKLNYCNLLLHAQSTEKLLITNSVNRAWWPYLVKQKGNLLKQKGCLGFIMLLDTDNNLSSLGGCTQMGCYWPSLAHRGTNLKNCCSHLSPENMTGETGSSLKTAKVNL